MRVHLLGILCTLWLGACTHTPTESPKFALGSGGLPFGIIDAHSHFNHPEKAPAQPAADMLEQFKKAGVIGAVVHLEAGEGAVTKVAKKPPVKLVVCAAVVPGETVANVEAGIKRGDYRCMKVYLGYVAKWAMDPFYLPFYRLAEKHNVPVAFHTGDTYSKNVFVKYADPLQLDEVAVKYPKVKFVIAHLGNPWIQSAAEVVYKNDNVYADVSALMLGDATKLNPEFVEEIVVKPIRWFFLYADNPKKILFGSDWPLLDVSSYVEVVKKAIPEAHWRAVFHDNAAELFGLK